MRSRRALSRPSTAALLGWLDDRDTLRTYGYAFLEGLSDRGTVAWGEALAVRASGPRGLEQASAIGSELAELAHGEGLGAVAPLATVGVAFDGADGRGRWSGWPGVCVRVPELVVHWDRDRCEAVANAWLRPGGDARLARARLEASLDALEAALPSASLLPVPERVAIERAADEDREDFEARVAEATAGVASGRLQKVVLARSVEHRAPSGWRFDPWVTLANLRAAQPSTTAFAWVQPGGRAFVGATPEVLLETRGLEVKTHALAGTAPGAGGALLSSGKDMREHGVTLEAIADALSGACSELHLASAPRLRPLEGLGHLETPVRGVLAQPSSLLALAARLHPTPAVGGWPRSEARAWLEREPLDRGWYAGPIGWIAPSGDGVLAVALRCALLDGPRAWTFAGAGIVEGSDPASEWRETELKLRCAERALAVREASA